MPRAETKAQIKTGIKTGIMTGTEAQTAPEPAARRLGPRPLALHLAVAALTWQSSRSAWPIWNSGSLPWKDAKAAAALRKVLQGVDPDAFSKALDGAVRARSLQLLRGIQAYQRHPYRRDLTDPPALWREGTTRLLDYGRKAARGRREGPVLLFVPSLINRAYILDLAAGGSLVRDFAARGFRPLLVDWDRPGPEERRFTLTDYIAGRLEAALDAALALNDGPVVAVGYCMGGLLALALAQRRRRDLAGLVLMATPYDFHASGAAQAKALSQATLGLGPTMDLLGELPVDAIQALFAVLDPQLVVRKFLSFGRLDPETPKASAFVALEDWLNDGVPLAASVARECLQGWYGENTPGEGRWQIAGRTVDPAGLELPALSLIPANDRIVPPGSARALAARLPLGEVLEPTLGHIGMVVSFKARAAVWDPLAEWCRAAAERAG